MADDTNTGKNNSGDWNSGNGNSGYRNSGNGNSGYRNSGNGNSGDWNSGYGNSGNWNSGDGNSGDGNSGDGNSGNWNSGNWNSGDGNSGYFCTEDGPVTFFDQPCDLTREEALEAIPCVDLPVGCEWVDASKMTDEEKSQYPSHTTTGGFLRVHNKTIREAFPIAWEKMDAETRQKFLDLPNFDAVKFEQITGVDVREKAAPDMKAVEAAVRARALRNAIASLQSELNELEATDPAADELGIAEAALCAGNGQC